MGIYKSTYDRPHLEWMSIGVNERFSIAMVGYCRVLENTITLYLLFVT